MEETTDKDGTTHYKKDGRYHREDGPAVERFNGPDMYFLKGIWYDFEEWLVKTPCEIPLEDIVQLKMHFYLNTFNALCEADDK